MQRSVRLIHHGVANPNRKLEVVIEAIRHLGNAYRLNLMLVNNNDAYYTQLPEQAAKTDNVRVIDPVAFDDILPKINQCDTGIFLCEPSTFNLRHCMPNKFFEFIQARLAIAVGPSPGMADFVKQHDLGIVSETFAPESMAKALREQATPENPDRWRKNADKSSVKVLQDI